MENQLTATLDDEVADLRRATKPTGESTSLGLSVSHDIVAQQHGGAIAVDSRVGEFTELVVRLRRTRKAAATAGTA